MNRSVQLLLSMLVFVSMTFGQASITAVRIPNAIADGGGSGSTGYPYAVFVQISNWTSGANSQAYLKLYSSSNNEYMWSSSGVWSNTTTYSTANQPTVSIDAGGNWSGWIYAKHNTSLGATAAVRAAKVGATSTNLTSSTTTFTILNMATNGGWIVRQNSPAVNKGIVAYSAGSIVGTYRTEDNAISEGYTYGSGGFKIAVPAGSVDSLACYNDDGSYYASFKGPWLVNGGSETDAGATGGIIGASLSLSPSLWKFNTVPTLRFVFKPSADTVKGVMVKVPTTFGITVGQITSQPTALVTVSNDTILASNINIRPSDSLVLTIANVLATDTTGQFGFQVLASKDGTTYISSGSSPTMLVYGNPRAISVVKQKTTGGVYSLLGKWAVVRGIVTVANEFAGGTAPGGPAYIQDGTAGATLYDTSIVNNVQHGDDVVVLGIVAPFNGLFELAPCSLLEVVSEGNSFDTSTVTIAQINSQPLSGVEPYEGRLVRINNVTSVTTTSGNPATNWAVTGSGTNYSITDATGTIQVRISPRINLANLPTPTGNFDLVCVVGKFNTSYQLLPRSIQDVVVEGGGPRIVSGVPYETNITSTGLTFVWQTDSPGSSKVYYGTTTSYTDSVINNTLTNQHQVAVAGLKSATMYHIRLGTANGVGTTYTNDYLVSTSSLSSTGAINVYFDYPVTTAIAQGENAQTVVIVSKLLSRINAATYSIDCALYSLSGTVGANVASALIAAKSRGVKVRVIGEADNSSTSPWTTLSNNSVPLIFDTFDPVNAGAGLMHNKFFVFDNQDSTSDTDDWVWSGSWNATDPGNNDDAQNVIEIQDKALANAYTTEFNEMWGSATGTPNAATSRFGAHKLDNTPHLFVVNGTPIESYFSPSDGTTSKIIKTLSKATNDINFSLLTFTRSDIANVLIAKYKAGIKVHGVMDNRTDQGSVFDTLVASGVDLHLKGSAVRGLYHHKYGLVDAETAHLQQYVITGSHNWSSSAENSNNENTLIIQSKRIANLYLQEFAARYAEAGGTDNITVNVSRTGDNIPRTTSLSQNFPNPFNPTTNFELRIAKSGFVSVKVFDLLGREVATLVNENKSPGVYVISWDASKLATGMYLYKMQTGGLEQTKKMLLVR
jgi:hypothetical protein